MAVAGNRSKEQILRAVTALGLKTSKGKSLSAQTFNKLLTNPVYAGAFEQPNGAKNIRAIGSP
jgi:hypothetical protein